MTCPSELVLDEVLSHGAAPAVGTHVDGCPRCQQRVAGRRADAERFAPFAPEIWRQVESAATARRRWWPVFLAAPTAAAAVLGVVLLAHSPAPDGQSPAYVGGKGSFTLAVAARRGSELFMIDASHPARPGDELRFLPSSSAGYRFVAIVSLDGNRALTLFYPPRPDAESPPLPPSGEALPGGIILDAAPGPERLFVVLSVRPLRGAEVESAIRAQVERRAAAAAALAHADAKVIEMVVAKTP